MNAHTNSNNLTEPDDNGASASLASQIMGLKKAAAANRVTGAKSVNKTAKKGTSGDTQVITSGDNP
jgi:hypothetical protein